MKLTVSFYLLSYKYKHLFLKLIKLNPHFGGQICLLDKFNSMEHLGDYRASIDYPGIKITQQIAVDSKNYLFLYLEVSPNAAAGLIPIELKKSRRDKIDIEFELKERSSSVGKHMGFDASDLIYLMMPDRFANGNPANDSIEGMLETADITNPERRQGGDLKGVMDHLDYIKEQGMTAIWLILSLKMI